MKRIGIFCDGTWNSPDKTQDGKPLSSNVVKLAELVQNVDASDVEQRVFYDAGIGTSGSAVRRVFDGATGSGMSKNIQDAYRFLVTHYEPGDELYFFGFSRGAFTVRSLAGLIRNSGLLRSDARERIEDAYALYRSRAPESHPRARESTLFRRTYAVEPVTPIHFIGVWDTVGALGNPVRVNAYLGYFGRKNEFHDTQLSSTVRHAYHALAVDEARKHFSATLWHQPAPVPGQVVEQVWFAGVHSNIGGGYPMTGLSDIALGWMHGRARSAGLGLEALIGHGDPMERLQESRKSLYRLVPAKYRAIRKWDVRGDTHEYLHESVVARYQASADYRPPNLVDYFAGPHRDSPAVH
ncbi:MAG: DUF2235 domain-containing protein [Gammaproteobacteria bacterium]|nr:DUF2235 domain-containing protein [Gammaproteobacteria bacterium]